MIKDSYKYEGSAKLASTHCPSWTVAIVEVGVPVIIIFPITTVMMIIIMMINVHHQRNVIKNLYM